LCPWVAFENHDFGTEADSSYVFAEEEAYPYWMESELRDINAEANEVVVTKIENKVVGEK